MDRAYQLCSTCMYSFCIFVGEKQLKHVINSIVTLEVHVNYLSLNFALKSEFSKAIMILKNESVIKAVKKPGGPRCAYMDGFCRQVSNVNRACYFLQVYKYHFLICVGF